MILEIEACWLVCRSRWECVYVSGVAPIGPGRALARPLIRQVGPGQARFGCFHDCALVKKIISTSWILHLTVMIILP